MTELCPMNPNFEIPQTELLSRFLKIPVERCDQARAIANTILSSPDLRPYFFGLDLENVWNEMDFVDDQGRIYRIDRLVELPDRFVILDYKLTIPEPGKIGRAHV